MDELVSIIVPTFNRADKIVACLQSLINQSYSFIEIVVVDDGSTDNTFEILNSCFPQILFGDKFSYFKQSNQGALIARNLGLIKAKGSLIVFFDSDDIMLPGRISKQVNSIIENNSDCCACGFIDSNNGHVFIPRLHPKKGSIGSLLSWNLMGSTQCWMYKKEILEKLGGYDLTYRYYDDWLLTFKYLSLAKKVSVVEENLTIYVNHYIDNERLTTSIVRKEKLVCIQNYYLYIIKWMLIEKKELEHLDFVIFLFVTQIILEPSNSSSDTKKLYNLFSKTIQKTSTRLVLKSKILLLKHFLKTIIKKQL